ncbi:MAG: hypothetical protein NT154_13235 [Verrucomicrobia bacterium]|nr:hypothetical protein [Verrucomicrobiota bacterium]
MAEVATSILHNVGNVLNNVNTSAGLVTALTRASKAQEISHVATLLKEHRADLAQYLTANGRANQLQLYVEALGQQVAAEQATTLGELQ